MFLWFVERMPGSPWQVVLSQSREKVHHGPRLALEVYHAGSRLSTICLSRRSVKVANKATDWVIDLIKGTFALQIVPDTMPQFLGCFNVVWAVLNLLAIPDAMSVSIPTPHDMAFEQFEEDSFQIHGVHFGSLKECQATVKRPATLKARTCSRLVNRTFGSRDNTSGR